MIGHRELVLWGTAGLLAAGGDAGDDLLGHPHLQLARGEVVQEKQGLGPLPLNPVAV